MRGTRRRGRLVMGRVDGRVLAGAVVCAWALTGCTVSPVEGADAVTGPAPRPDASSVEAAAGGTGTPLDPADLALPGLAVSAGDAEEADEFDVRGWEGLGGDWVEPTSWSGQVLLDLGEGRLRERTVTSAGYQPLRTEQVQVLQLSGGGGGIALPLVLPGAPDAVVGALLAAQGAYGSALDLDGDGGVDVLDVVLVPGAAALQDGPDDRVRRMVLTSEAGRRWVDEGSSTCPVPPGSGVASPPAGASLALGCGGAGVSGRALPRTGGGGPVLPVGGAVADRLEAAATVRDAVAAVRGAGDGPDAGQRADAAQLLEDLDRYGAEVVTGALLNDALSTVLPEGATDLLQALGEEVADGNADAEAAARALGRSTDDLRDGAAVIISLLGEDPGTADGTDGSGGAGCELTTDDGACVDGAGAGGAFGDPHLLTHDGLAYDLQVVGDHLLTEVGASVVQVRWEPYRGSDRISVTTAVAVGDGTGTAQVALGEAGWSVRLDGTEVPPGERRSAAGLTVDRTGPTTGAAGGRGTSDVVVRTADLVARLRLAPVLADVAVSPIGGPVQGLLGDADGDPADDLVVAGRVVVPADLDLAGAGQLSRAWRVGTETSLLPYGPGEDPDTFADDTFPAAPLVLADLPAADVDRARLACRGAGVRDLDLLTACVVDVAATGEPSLAAGSAALQRAVGGPGGRAEAAPDPAGHVVVPGPDGDLVLPVPRDGWASEVVRAAAQEAGSGSGRAEDVLGPRDTRNVTLGEADEVCGLPLVVRTGTPVRDRPGPDLAVVQIGAGDGRYEVWLGTGPAASGGALDAVTWVLVGAASRPAAFDVGDVLPAPAETSLVRLCDAPAGVDGPLADQRGGGDGPAVDAVAVVDTSAALVVPRGPSG